MTHQIIVLACVLRTIESGPTADARCQTPYVQELVAAFKNHDTEVPADIEAAKCYHESHFDKHALGTHGEIGICQPKRHGAIQGKDLKLKRSQIEDIETNVRISAAYISRFVHRCAHPSGWLTMYNRPARGCRASRYSLGILADLRHARTMGRKLPLLESGAAAFPRLSEPTSLSWANPFQVAQTSPSTVELYTQPVHISHTGEGSDLSTPSDTGGRRPAGTRRLVQSILRESRSEEELAVPFQEP